MARHVGLSWIEDLDLDLELAEEVIQTELTQREPIPDPIVQSPTPISRCGRVPTRDLCCDETQSVIPWRRLQIARESTPVAQNYRASFVHRVLGESAQFAASRLTVGVYGLCGTEASVEARGVEVEAGELAVLGKRTVVARDLVEKGVATPCQEQA
jgi:hypothetical protein